MQRQTDELASPLGRREFLRSAGAVAASLYLAGADSPVVAQGPAAAVMPEAPAVKKAAKTVTAKIGNAVRWPIYGEEEEREVIALLRNVNYTPIAEFEKAWSEFHKSPYCKAHCNGTSALTSMLFALDLPPGSEILVPDLNAWFAIVAMRHFGLVPVWVDVDPRTMNIDVADCKRRLTKNTRAIMPVHWLGLPCDMDAICDFAEKHGLEVVEDASHAPRRLVEGPAHGHLGPHVGLQPASHQAPAGHRRRHRHV